MYQNIPMENVKTIDDSIEILKLVETFIYFNSAICDYGKLKKC